MSYNIVGADQKQYGPISLEQLRQWLAEGRVNAQTMVQAEGSTEWKPLASFPELMPIAVPGVGFSPLALTPEAARGTALSLINGPATGLLVTGILGLLMALAGIALNTLGVSMSTLGLGGAQGGDQAQRAINLVSGGAGILSGILHIVLSAVIIYGAVQMKKLVNFRLALAAAILALAPCLSPCCLLGLPFGIWALVTLNKPEVKSAFQ